MVSSFPILSGTLDQSQWVPQINELVQEPDLEAALQTPVSVFQLPDSVRDGAPEAYIPRRVALGPYHHFRPDLYKMDLFKLAKVNNPELGPQLHQLALQLKLSELKIRACFDQPLAMDVETLSWVLLIDGLFLFELLQIRYSPGRRLELPLNIFYGRLSSEFDIVCDMLKLENQIPFFVLEEILNQSHEYLASLFFQLSQSVSPFQLVDPHFTRTRFDLLQIYSLSHHLLHFLYFLVLRAPDRIIPQFENGEIIEPTWLIYSDISEEMGTIAVSFATFSLLFGFIGPVLGIMGTIFKIAFIKPLKETIDLIQRLFGLLGSVKTLNLVAKNPTALIPSASYLKKAGVVFKSTKNGILECRFDESALTLTLPCMHVDGFSQVFLRNLLAFEVMAELNPPCLVQYIALMNGLLTNSKDLQILEEAGIVDNHLQSEEEALELFNGVNNSISSFKKTSVLDIHLKSIGDRDMEIESKFIEEIMRSYDKGLKGMVEKINTSYEKCWSFKMKKFGVVVFKYFAILVIVLLMLLVIGRFLCTFFSCPANIFTNNIGRDGISLRVFDYISSS